MIRTVLRLNFKALLAVPLLVLSILLTPAGVGAADVCTQDEKDEFNEIRCLLWRLSAFLRPLDNNFEYRTSGSVALGPKRWVEVEALVGGLDSAWPEEVVIRFYEGTEGQKLIVEEIRDHGLNGLDPEDEKDAYIRYTGGEQQTDLLESLDPKLKQPLNNDYLCRLKVIISTVEKRIAVHQPYTWEKQAPGLELTELYANRYVRLGENRLKIIRFSPEKFEFIPYSHIENQGHVTDNIEGWALRLPGAPVIFNSGQYYPDHRYIGLLLKNGRDLGTGLHPKWKALLLSGGDSDIKGAGKTTILDLEAEVFDPDKTSYKYAIQSFMLLDRNGRPRVRRTERLASRTVVAQDIKGRMLIVFAPGACTLYELALLLKESDLQIKQALCLDGGFESQIFLRHNPENIAEYGSWVVNERRQYHNRNLRLPLPAVIALSPLN